MQGTLEKTVTKADFITALRSDKFDQLQDGRMFDNEGKVCALMVWHLLNNDTGLNSPIGAGNSIFGMPSSTADRIATLNDSGCTFSEIADILDNDPSRF